MFKTVNLGKIKLGFQKLLKNKGSFHVDYTNTPQVFQTT